MNWIRISGLATVGLLTLACGDDSSVVPMDDTGTTGDTDDTNGTTVDPTLDPTLDPSTSSTATDTIDPDSSGTSADSDSSGETPTCGNGMLDDDEICDGDELGAADCGSEGFDDGALACAADCMSYDTDACVTFACGNDITEGIEQCDGNDLAGADCASEGFDGGMLSCAADCMGYDTSACMSFECGDSMIQGMEVCDGVALLGETCISQGFDAGPLACDMDCMGFDTLSCITFMCGNDMLEGIELCDGADLNGLECTTLGFDAGPLGCLADCTDFDTTACENFNCGNDLIEGLETCDGVDLGGATCVTEGFDGGVLACDSGCAVYDTSGCTLLSCGNDLIEGVETCDGADLGGQDCIGLGFPGGGVLACEASCQEYDLGGCTFGCEEEDIGMSIGPAVAMGNTVGEDDDLASSCAGAGPDRIVRFTAPSDGDFLIDTFGSDYDTVLSLFSECNAMSEITCNDDAMGLQSQIFASMTAGQTLLIAVEGLGGDTGNWILNIEQTVCMVEENIGVMVGNPVTSGNTTLEDEDLPQSCADGGAVDRVISWTAPATATFVFDTFGSSYDTALSAYSACSSAAELVCNDDAGVGVQSEISLALTVGEQIILAVSGYSGDTGDWVLNINQI